MTQSFLRWLAMATIVSLAITVSAASKPVYSQAVSENWVVRITFASEQQLSELARTLDVWEVQRSAAYLVAMVDGATLRGLRQAGFRVDVDQARTARVRERPVMAAGQSSGIPGYACYRTVSETYHDMAQLAADHPSLVKLKDIGDSWDKMTASGPPGYDLMALVITNWAKPGPKFRFFDMGAIHARELVTSESALRFAESLVAGYGVDPDITWLLDYGEAHLVIVANPDGRNFADQGYYWRKNTNNDQCSSANPPLSPGSSSYGIDLNRNASFKWGACDVGGCSSSNACLITYRGPSPASEPETQVLQSYLAGIFPDRRGPADSDAAPLDTEGVALSLHSYSRLVLYPWAWTSNPAPNGDQLRMLGRKFGFFTDYSVCQPAGCLYSVDGSMDDWAYGELGIASYVFEIGDEFFEQCSVFENSLLPDVQAAQMYAFKAARRPYQTPFGPEILNVVVTPTIVLAGSPVTLTATVDSQRYSAAGGSDPALQPVAGARLTVGKPSWAFSGTVSTASAVDGAFDSTVEVIEAELDTTGWTPGRHLIFVEGSNAADQWGTPSAVFVEVLAAQPYALTLQPSVQKAQVQPGQTVTYSLTVHNRGSMDDQYELLLESTWPVTATGVLSPVLSLAQVQVTVEVQTPLTATVGATHVVSLTVQSLNEPAANASARLLTDVGWRIFLPWIGRR